MARCVVCKKRCLVVKMPDLVCVNVRPKVPGLPGLNLKSAAVVWLRHESSGMWQMRVVVGEMGEAIHIDHIKPLEFE